MFRHTPCKIAHQTHHSFFFHDSRSPERPVQMARIECSKPDNLDTGCPGHASTHLAPSFTSRNQVGWVVCKLYAITFTGHCTHPCKDQE